MKKIGIITFHRAINFGAVLQAYALQKYLMNNNYDVEDIDYYPTNENEKYKLINFKRIKNIKEFISDFIYYIPKKIKTIKFNKFIKKEIRLSQNKYTEKNIKNIKEKYDVCICGSDQIWNCNLLNEVDKAYFLQFGDNHFKKVSYAPSIGNAAIDTKFESEIQSYLNTFSKVSIREEKSIPVLKKLGIDSVSVLDPVFLLEKKDWEEKLNERLIKEKYILSYVLSANKDYYDIVDKIAKEKNLKIVHFGLKNKKYKNKTTNYYSASPLEFLNLIKNAEIVVTTSFHATAFSVIFNKKFLSVPFKNNGDRIVDLLNKLGLNEYSISNFKMLNMSIFEKNIDYKSVNEKILIQRKQSQEWLINAIEE